MFQSVKEGNDSGFNLESLNQEALEHLAHLASFVFGTSVSCVNIIKGDMLIIKSSEKLPVKDVPLDLTFCKETISREASFVIEDTLKSVFANYPHVTGNPSLRFYAGTPLKTSDGEIIGTVCVLDYTPKTVTPQQIKSLEIFAQQLIAQFELANKHKELNKLKGLLEKVLDAMPLGVTVSESNGNVFYSNNKSAELLGQSVQSKLVGNEVATTYNLRYAGEDKPYTADRSPTFAAMGGKASYVNTLEIHRKDTIVPIQLWASPIVTDGSVSHVITVFDDISEQNTIEKKLKESEKNYRNLVEDIGDVVYISDPFGNFTFVNNRVTKLVGYTPKDLIGKHYTLMVHPDFREKVEAFYHKQFKEKKEETVFEFPIITKTGEKIWVEQSARVWWDTDGKIKNFHCMVRDIESRKQTESALIEAKQFAEEAKQLQEIFLANMSHEVRTPMNGVLGVANLLAQTNLTAKQKGYVDAIQLSGNNLMVIINDILDLTKISSGKMSFEDVPFHLQEVIDNSVFFLKSKAEGKGLSLNVEMDPELNSEITGDPTRLSQVLINLLGNAVKFTEKGFVALKVEKESENEERIDIKFIIEDSGIGISQEKIDAIFEKFTQERSDTTRKFGGTGLGLSITKQLVNLQKGTISVTSKVGVGSCFAFTMSFGKVKHPEQKIEVIISETRKSLEGITILLAEDNEINQMVAVDTLERWNATVDVAENGKIVLEKMTQNPYDLILMDLQMPEMGGEECTKKIRDNYVDKHANIPIIAMTASAFKKEKEKCLAIGMNGYVSKPFFPEDLYSEISTVLHSSKIDFNKKG